MSIPAHWQAAATLTLFAALLLCTARAFGHGSRGPSLLALLGCVLAIALGVLGGSDQILPVVASCGSALIALLLLPHQVPEVEEHRVEIAALLLLGAVGGIALGAAQDLLTVVIGLEVLSLSIAVLTGLTRGQAATEAAFKYFMLAAVSVATMLYGVALLALSTGSLHWTAVAPSQSHYAGAYQAALVLITLGACFKLGVVPLHFGALGVYQTAAPGLTGYLMATSKVGAVLVLVKIAAMGGPTGPVLVALGVVSIVWGTLGALAQNELRGMLAYSALANAGFLALALGSGPAGRGAAVFFVVVYATTTLLIFAAIGKCGTDRVSLNRLPDLNLGPLANAALGVGLLSLAGVPPAPGFWAKLAVLAAAWNTGGLWAASIAIAGAVAGALYYLRPLPDLLAGMQRDTSKPDGWSRSAMLTAGLVVLLFTVAPYLAARFA